MSFSMSVYYVMSCSHNIASYGMSRVCIHTNVHEYHASNDICRESLDMVYQCIFNEVMKTPTAKNFAIVMATSKKILAYYLLKSPSNDEGYHLACSSLKVVINKFNIFTSPNYRNFVLGSKHFVRSEMGTMDSIMALKGHSGFKYVHGSKFPRQFCLQNVSRSSGKWCGSC